MTSWSMQKIQNNFTLSLYAKYLTNSGINLFLPIGRNVDFITMKFVSWDT